MDEEHLDSVLATVHELLQAEGMNEAANVVRAYVAHAEQSGYDNWNGGTELWDVLIEVPAADYARFGGRRACPRFCVNGFPAGDCRLTRRHHEPTQARGTRRAA